MAKAKTFPKQIFVKIETESGTSYLVADDQWDGLVDMGERIKLGVYQLVEVKTAEGVARFTK